MHLFPANHPSCISSLVSMRYASTPSFLAVSTSLFEFDEFLLPTTSITSHFFTAAFIAACALAPKRDEFTIARRLRAASPTATPNARLVALADAALGRNGRMNEAVAAIGRGEECFEGTPFTLELA